MAIDHIYETLKAAIDILAAGTGRIQERLADAWLVIHSLEEDSFPLELRDEVDKLSDAFSTQQQSAIHADGRLRTVDQASRDRDEIDDAQARALALLIVQLFAHTSAQYWPTHKYADRERHYQDV
jgi:hypothetical protein